MDNLYEVPAPRLLTSFCISDVSIQDIIIEIARVNTKLWVPIRLALRLQKCVFRIQWCQNFQQIYRKIQIWYTTENYEDGSLVLKGKFANNYRPISLLSCFNKFLKEKYADNYFVSRKNKLLFWYQFGFIKLYSITLALIEITYNGSEFLNDSNFVLRLFAEKVFGTVDHEILVYKINNYGISDNTTCFQGSYLTGR